MSHKHFTLTAVRTLLPSNLELHYADGAVLSMNLASIIQSHPIPRLSG